MLFTDLGDTGGRAGLGQEDLKILGQTDFEIHGISQGILESCV